MRPQSLSSFCRERLAFSAVLINILTMYGHLTYGHFVNLLLFRQVAYFGRSETLLQLIHSGSAAPVMESI
jgi:hypothetical protein